MLRHDNDFEILEVNEYELDDETGELRLVRPWGRLHWAWQAWAPLPQSCS